MAQELHRIALILVAAGLFPALSSAQSGTWTTNAAGAYNWSDVANWQSGVVADGADNAATFTMAGLTGNITANLDSPRTIGALTFGNPANTFGWSITGNTLTLSDSAGPTIAVNSNITATIAATLAGAQGFTKTGPGTLALTGNNTGLAGGITVSAGALLVSGGGGVNPLGTAPLTLSGGNLLFGGIAQNYASNVTLTADSTITAAAPTTIGNMTIGSNTLSVSGLTAGIVNLTGNPTFNGDLTIGAFQDGGTARTITKTGGGALTLVASVTSGISAGTTVVVSAGTVNVNGDSAFGPSPNVTINGGTVNLNSAFAFGTTPNVTVNTGTVNLLQSSAVFQSLSGSPGPNGSGVVTLNGGILFLRAASTSAYGGTIGDGSGPGNVQMRGSGNQILSGVNTYTGGTFAIGGTLTATVVGALSTGPVFISGGILSVAGAPAGTAVINNFGPASNWALNGSATFTATNQLQLTPSGGGTGSAWFTTPLPTGPFSLKFTYTVLSGSNPPADGFTVGFQNQGLTALGAAGGSVGYGGISPSTAAQFNIYPPNTVGGSGSGLGLVTNGTVQNPVPSTFPVNLGAINAPTNVTLSYDGQNLRVFLVQGQNAYSSPAMPLNLATTLGSNAYFGFTGATGARLSQQQITNLQFGGPGFSTYPNDVDLFGGTIQVATTPLAPAVTIGNLTFQSTSGGYLNVTADPGTAADQPFSLSLGTTTLNGGSVFNVVNNGTGTGTLTLGSVINGSNGPFEFTKTGSGTLILPAAGTYTGSTTINGGTLDLNNAAGMGPLPVVIVNRGTLNLLAGINPSFMSLGGPAFLSGGDGGTVLLNGNVLTVGSASSNYFGVIADGVPAGGSLVKTGAGTQTLSGANTYTGGTTVGVGKLVAANTSGSATGSGVVTVLNGGTLAGGNGGGSGNPFADSSKGFIDGAVTLQPGGALSPGVGGPGLLAVGGAVTFQAASVWSIDLGTHNPRPGAQPVDVNTNSRVLTPLDILFGGALTMPIDGGGLAFAVGSHYDFFVGQDGGTSGSLPTSVTFLPTDFANPAFAGDFLLSRSGDYLIVSFTPSAVAEPSSLLLTAAAAGFALARSRLARRRAPRGSLLIEPPVGT